MPPDSSTNAARLPSLRSAVTNGRSLFIDGDGRGAHARRFRDVLWQIVEDLGGREDISEGQRVLARQAAGLNTLAEDMLSKIGKGEAVCVEDYVRIVNALNRTLGSLELKRRQRDVTPNPLEYIRQAAGAE